MSTLSILEQLKQPNQIAVLIDPEKCQSEELLNQLIERINFAGIHFVFVGGSSVTEGEFNFVVSILSSKLRVPLVIFPGSSDQVSSKADAILYLSLLSGRNPDYLIGHHVHSAQKVADARIEVIPTAYLLIDGGSKSSVAYVSQTTPIPPDKESIVRQTALAGKFQGKQVLFLDAGSGAQNAVPHTLVQAVKNLELPIIIGGGIKTIDEIRSLHGAGANVVVIGNKIEAEIDFLLDLHTYAQTNRSSLLGE